MLLQDVKTYRDLINYLFAECKPEVLDQNITIYRDGEYIQAKLMISELDCDILDEGHLFLF
jgi:hypothetical protein